MSVVQAASCRGSHLGSSLPLLAQVYLYLVGLAGAGCLLFWTYAWHGPRTADAGLMALFVGLAVVAQQFPLLVGPRRKVNLSIAVYFAGLLLFGAAPAVALVGLAQLLGQSSLALRRDPKTGRPLRSPRSVLFNTGQYMLAAGLGGLVYYSLLPHLAPAPLERPENLWAVPAAAAAMHAANTLCVAGMAGLQLGQNPLEIWLAARRADAPEAAGLFLIGLAAAIVFSRYLWAAPVLALPAGLLWLSLKRATRLLEAERSARLEAEAAAERVQALQATVEQERATLAAVLAGMTDGLFVLDAAGCVRYTNARAAELLGLGPAPVGQPISAILRRVLPSPVNPAAALAQWQELLAAGNAASVEITLAGPPRRDIVVTAFPISDAPEAARGLLLHDATDARALALHEDRSRIAMDLHDGAIQALYGVALGLSARARQLDSGAEAARTAMQQAIDQINEVIKEIRNYIFDLRPQDLSAPQLTAALTALAREIEINALVRVELDLDPEAEGWLCLDGVAGLLQIAREATSNIIRHARASRAAIRLARCGDRVVLTVADNGAAFDLASGARHGLGLINMAERARALGGRLEIVSEPARGTEVRVDLPIQASRQAA